MKISRQVDIQPRWLIIQQARFGDLMQTAPVLEGAAEMELPPRIDLLVDYGLTDLAQRLEGVQSVYTGNRHMWLKELDNPVRSLVDLRRTVGQIPDDLRPNSYNRVINLTHTTESAYLAALIRSDFHNGLVGHRSGISAADSWERFFQAMLPRRNLNPFNLVDIHLGIAEVKRPGRNGKVRLGQPVAETPSGFSCPMIAIQLGANSPLRRPPVESIAEVICQIYSKLQAKFILVGSKDEKELAERLIRISSQPIIDLTGETTLVELGEWLSRCDLLISGDTGTLHLAAAIGLPTVSLFLGMAQPQHTGPYGKGHIILTPRRDCYPCDEHCQCAHMSCHMDIPPRAIASLVLQALAKETAPCPNGATFDVRVTDFSEDGFLILRDPVTGSESSAGKALKQFWDSELTDTLPGSCLPESGLILNPEDHERLRLLSELGFRAEKAYQRALSQRGKALRMRETLVEFVDLEAQMMHMAGFNDLAGMLVHMYQMERRSLSDDASLESEIIGLALGALTRRSGYLAQRSERSTGFTYCSTPELQVVSA